MPGHPHSPHRAVPPLPPTFVASPSSPLQPTVPVAAEPDLMRHDEPTGLPAYDEVVFDAQSAGVVEEGRRGEEKIV